MTSLLAVWQICNGCSERHALKRLTRNVPTFSDAQRHQRIRNTTIWNLSQNSSFIAITQITRNFTPEVLEGVTQRRHPLSRFTRNENSALPFSKPSCLLSKLQRFCLVSTSQLSFCCWYHIPLVPQCHIHSNSLRQPETYRYSWLAVLRSFRIPPFCPESSHWACYSSASTLLPATPLSDAAIWNEYFFSV